MLRAKRHWSGPTRSATAEDGPRRTAFAAVVGATVLCGAACVGLGRGGSAEATPENRIAFVSGLLRVEDRRDYDPLLVGRAAGSRDAWVRSRAALTCGRLRDVEASIYLPVLLRDPDPSVRRAAAFASGISADRRLVTSLIASLSDPDAETASGAAAALGRLGGVEAEGALRSVLAGASGPTAASALALFSSRDSGLGPALSASIAVGDPGLRKAAAWALARIPGTGSGPALRGLLDDPDSEIVAWAARGLGLLEDGSSASRLLAIAKGSESGPSIQALLALERIAARNEAAAQAREAGLARFRDDRPGVAVAALTLLRRFAAEPDVREALAGLAAAGGRRGGVALASLAAGDPDRAFRLAFPRRAPAPLDLRLGAAEALPFVPAESLATWIDALLADPAARVRMETISRIPKGAAATLSPRLVRGLGDPDASVRAAALDAAAPLASGPAANPQVRQAWRTAFGSALLSREPDLVASALDAAAELAEGGRDLLAARRDDPDDLVRARARRLLVDRFGEDPNAFTHRAFVTRPSASDYERLSAAAESTRFVATIATARGSFVVELFPREAPMTVDSFVALARKGFFDGTTIHRVVSDFVVQAGDPRGDGTGGPDYALRDELNPLPYVRGRIGMALSGPDTGGSQWFVTLSRQPHLDGAYTVFGEVTEGMEVVERIEQNDRLVSVHVREERRDAPPGPISNVR